MVVLMREEASSEIARWEEWRMRSGGEIFIPPRRRYMITWAVRLGRRDEKVRGLI
jgi:hypothetical protein